MSRNKAGDEPSQTDWISQTYNREFKERGEYYFSYSMNILSSPQRFIKQWHAGDKTDITPWQFLSIGAILVWLMRGCFEWLLLGPSVDVSILVSTLDLLKGGMYPLVLALPVHLALRWRGSNERIATTLAVFIFAFAGPGLLLEALMWVLSTLLVWRGTMTLSQHDPNSLAVQVQAFSHLKYSELVQWGTLPAIFYVPRMLAPLHKLSLWEQAVVVAGIFATAVLLSMGILLAA